MDREKLIEEIEKLRIELVKLVMQKGNFLDLDVVELSQQLDKIVVRYQQLSDSDFQENKVSA